MPLAPLYPDDLLYPGDALYPSDGADQWLHPSDALYPSDALFPGEQPEPDDPGGSWLYPSDDLYPGSDLYPGEQPDTPAAAWPDVERAVCDLLAGLGSVGTETRPGLQATLPYIRVQATGGTDDRVTSATTVSVDVLAAGRTEAMTIAEQARQLLRAGLPAVTAHGLIDWAVTIARPVLLPPTDSGRLRMAVASYRVSMRRPAQ